jgi:hypothetical protein
MRRLGTLVIALLLATAAAAGVKWTRTDELPFATPLVKEALLTQDLRAATQKYLLSWESHKDLEYLRIDAIMFSWEIRYKWLLLQLEKGELDYDEYRGTLDKARTEALKYIDVVITAVADKETHARLSNREYWDIYLDVNGQNVAPLKIEFDRDSAKALLAFEDFGFGYYSPAIYFKKTYLLRFENPKPGLNPGSVKLVLSSERCRRGFEWRFKQD